MALVKYRNRKTAKKVYKRKSIRRKPSQKSLVKLIKKVTLKQCETKHTHEIIENQQLYHNSFTLYNGLLNTTQAISDTGSGTVNKAARVGDEIIARGISIKFWIANKLDRPNVMYKIVLYKYQSLTPPLVDLFLTQGGANVMIRDFNTEKYSIVAMKTFNVQMGFSAYATGTGGDQDGREAHKLLKFWVPLKNKKVQYQDGGTIPKNYDYGFAVMCYDSYGTLTTDNIASFAINYKLYFKDP